MEDPAKNRETAVLWMEEVWNNRRDELVPKLMQPDAIGHIEGGEVCGPAEFLAFRNSLVGAMPNLKVHIDGAIADNDCVVLRWRVTGTHSGEGLGISPRNTPVAFSGMTWFRFVDGKLAEGWDCWNQGHLMNTLQMAALAPA